MIAWKTSLPGFEHLIHQVWYLEVDQAEQIEPKPHLIPNPRAHLLFTPTNQPYGYSGDKASYSGRGSHLLGINESLLLLQDEPPLVRIGLTFRPESLYLLDKSAAKTTNQCGWPEWLEALFDAEYQASLFRDTNKQTLLKAIAAKLSELNLDTKRDRAFLNTSNAVELVESQKFTDIEALALACNCSRRTLERNFKLVLGISLKQYLQMNRLEEMILALYQQEQEIDWASFSQQFGFSDQSHLIRTLKQQLHKTPANYLKKRDLTIDIYGDFE